VKAQPKAELKYDLDALDSITDVPLTHPLPDAITSTRDEKASEMEKFTGPRTLRRRISVLFCSLNCCIAFTKSPSSAKFLRTIPHALRMVYTVAVAFRRLLVQFAEIYPIRMDDAFKTDWEKLVLRWNTFMPGPNGGKKLEHDELPSMDSEKFNGMNTAVSEEHDGPDPDLDEEDEDTVDRNGEGIVIRV
jgi:hypothetical protein